MEETSSQSYKNKYVNMQYHEELKGNKRRPYTKAAEGLTSILLMLLTVSYSVKSKCQLFTKNIRPYSRPYGLAEDFEHEKSG